MRKAFAILLCVLLLCTGCGNHQFIDTTWTYNYAIIELPNGEIIEGKVESWNDYEGEQLQVKINGVTYLTNSFHCVLMQK